jgi:hypothetical protein
MERLVMSGYDYSVLAGVGDDVLLLEWDVAVGGEELAAFAARAAEQPDRVLAAPYRLHPGCSIRGPARAPCWSAWHYRGGDQQLGGLVEVTAGDPVAHVSGLGLVYLPRRLILRYLAEREPGWGFSDIAFSGWHFRRVRPEILLDWSARPVHLHYQIPTVEGS